MPKRVAVIVNPTKFEDLDEVRRRATQACVKHGWDEPLWIETTAEDTGAGQARHATAEGVDLVCPLGGAGTVRAVAAEMVGTGIPVGLLLLAVSFLGQIIGHLIGTVRATKGETMNYPFQIKVLR